MDLAVRRLLPLLVVCVHLSSTLLGAHCARVLNDDSHTSSGTVIEDEDAWLREWQPVANEDQVPVTLFELDSEVEGSTLEVDGAESPSVGGMEESQELEGLTEMEVVPRSIEPSTPPPVAPAQPAIFRTGTRRAQSPVSHSNTLGSLALGMLVVAALAVGLMLGAIGGLFFLRMRRDK